MKRSCYRTTFIMVGLYFSFIISCHQDYMVQIRVENISDIDFDTVEVMGIPYGEVVSGDFSDYHTFDKAYRIASVTVNADNREYRLTVIDYVGEEPLEGGRYTLRLNILNPTYEGSLTQEMVRD
jgi:hypothetical protein